MKILHSINDVDPIPPPPRSRNPLDAWFTVVRPVLDPDADAGWLNAWADSKVVADKPQDLGFNDYNRGGSSYERVGDHKHTPAPVVAAPDGVPDGATHVRHYENPKRDTYYRPDPDGFARFWIGGEWRLSMTMNPGLDDTTKFQRLKT